MAKRYTMDQRGRIGEKLLDLGNIAAGALLFSQFISDKPFDFQMASVGIIILTVLYLVGLKIIRGGD